MCLVSTYESILHLIKQTTFALKTLQNHLYVMSGSKRIVELNLMFSLSGSYAIMQS